jgi:hypothetical protein
MNDQPNSPREHEKADNKTPVKTVRIGIQDAPKSDKAPTDKVPILLRLLSALWQVVKKDWNRSGIAKLTAKEGWPLFLGFLAIAVAARTLGVLSGQLDTMNRQLEEIHSGSADTHKLANAAVTANRAWVAPEQMVLESPIETGLPLKYRIRIVNPGKEPGLGSMWNVRAFGVPYIRETGEMLNFGPNNTCVGIKLNPKSGVVLYPTGSTDFWIPLRISDSPRNRSLLQAVAQKQKSLVIEGCIAYLTDGERHTSRFRFFLRDVPGPSFIVDKNGNKAAAWNFNATLDGNDAN